MKEATSKPTYSVQWSRWTGKYVAACSARPSLTVVDADPFVALADLQKVLALLA